MMMAFLPSMHSLSTTYPPFVFAIVVGRFEPKWSWEIGHPLLLYLHSTLSNRVSFKEFILLLPSLFFTREDDGKDIHERLFGDPYYANIRSIYWRHRVL